VRIRRCLLFTMQVGTSTVRTWLRFFPRPAAAHGTGTVYLMAEAHYDLDKLRPQHPSRASLASRHTPLAHSATVRE
jgi:hypothetical protein